MSDEFSDFDPYKHWAEANNETMTRGMVRKKDIEQIDRIADFCNKAKPMKDIMKGLKLSQGQIIHYLALMKNMKLMSLERTEIKHLFYYKVYDSRKKTLLEN